MIRTFQVSAKSPDRISVKFDVRFTSETGTLTKHEMERLKAVTASRLMQIVPGLPFLNVELSEVKVKR